MPDSHPVRLHPVSFFDRPSPTAIQDGIGDFRLRRTYLDSLPPEGSLPVAPAAPAVEEDGSHDAGCTVCTIEDWASAQSPEPEPEERVLVVKPTRRGAKGAPD